MIARDGGRGLSHRSVDAQLSLPVGSVSYYFRTRQALLDAAVARLVERDDADVREVFAKLRKFEVRPGITGYNQSTLRNAATMEERVANDLYYLDHLSARLDMSIVLATVRSVLGSKNINR